VCPYLYRLVVHHQQFIAAVGNLEQLAPLSLNLDESAPIAVLLTDAHEQEFVSGNMSKEAAFQSAVTAVQQAASEQELDERVTLALGNLDA